MRELIVEGATIVDGTGAPGTVGSVGVRDDRIAWVTDGPIPAVSAEAVRLEGDGLVLAPGFVDVHNHSDLSPLVEPTMDSAIRQGVHVGGRGQLRSPRHGRQRAPTSAPRWPAPNRVLSISASRRSATSSTASKRHGRP